MSLLPPGKPRSGEHATVHPVELIAGRYRTERVLGSGAMGLVVAARDQSSNQLVAIKLIRPQVTGNAQIVQRFVREARAAAQLRSPHVARVLDVGAMEDGTPYLVMEHLEGLSLADLLAAEGRLPVALAADYVLQACHALGEAHGLGIVHRDLKPENLFVARQRSGENVIKVLDFGISKTPAPAEISMTATASFMGSPAYMSPEQMRSAHTVDARADIWSLGIILWELVTGSVPFVAEGFTELCLCIALDPLPPLSVLAQAPPGFECVLARCLEKRASDRYRDVGELAGDLVPFAGRSSMRTPVPPRAPAPRAAARLVDLTPHAGEPALVLFGAPGRDRPPPSPVVTTCGAVRLVPGTPDGARRLGGEPISASWVGLPLWEAALRLERPLGLRILVPDEHRDTPVTLRLDQTPAGLALEWVLRDIGLGFETALALEIDGEG